MTIVLGLTGGMAAGKSTVSDLFWRAGIPVFDADACVRELQKPNGRAIPMLKKAFPEIVTNGVMNKDKLRNLIAQDETILPLLESIMHPLVRQKRNAFIHHCRSYGVKFCLLDVPLLWETGADKECDFIIVAHAPLSVRLARIRRRFRQKGGNMSESDARNLIARQMSDKERKRCADIVLQTGLSRGHLARQVKALIHRLTISYSY